MLDSQSHIVRPATLVRNGWTRPIYSCTHRYFYLLRFYLQQPASISSDSNVGRGTVAGQLLWPVLLPSLPPAFHYDYHRLLRVLIRPPPTGHKATEPQDNPSNSIEVVYCSFAKPRYYFRSLVFFYTSICLCVCMYRMYRMYSDMSTGTGTHIYTDV